MLQMCLGTVYAWSFFQKPLVAMYGWTNTEVAWVFSIAICFLGLSAAWGGTQLRKFGPRRMAMAGGLLFGLGYIVGGFALSIKSLPLLYLGYGVIGGCGLGFGYVTPVATVAKWFDKNKGLATGMVIMGFGFGALIMSKLLAPALIEMTRSAAAPHGDMVKIFVLLGVFFLIAAPLAGFFIVNPPAAAEEKTPESSKSAPVRKYLLSRKFITIWCVFFCNIIAGISIISFQSPLLQSLYKKTNPSLSPETLAAFGATLIAVSSIFNGLGRFFWGGVSDRIGRTNTFRIMLGSQILVFIALIFAVNPIVFSLLICYILLCYGGGFGTMPSFISTVFGGRLMPIIYGTVLTAWSMAGIFGPQIVARITDHAPASAAMYSFAVSTGVLLAGFLVTLTLNDRKMDIG
jgi:OFA family oxalate/formate antiporter-like MFS transporter